MRYDTTLKTLFLAPPPQLLQLLVGGQAHTMLTVEYPTVQMRCPDLVVRLMDGRLYHLELQSTNDSAMPWRMLEYFGLLCQYYGQPPLQQVLDIIGFNQSRASSAHRMRETDDDNSRGDCVSRMQSPSRDQRCLRWSDVKHL